MTDELQIRVHGAAELPALIYLPGTHGDWTLIGSFRRALPEGRVRFVEFTYPPTETWSLEDYAAAVEAALLGRGIRRGWLLAESFGSQIAWPLVARKDFQCEGIILAGGFARHPVLPEVRLASRIIGAVPLSWVRTALAIYARVSRFRQRHSPELRADIHEFVARRTEPDRQAILHRLRLIVGGDFRRDAGKTSAPVFAITGLLDLLVPWPFVRPWLRRHCPALRDFRIVWSADHNVLSTAPETSVAQVLRWITADERAGSETGVPTPKRLLPDRS
jgi:pimeloyl-ACP methyl ester carboxylesterase